MKIHGVILALAFNFRPTFVVHASNLRSPASVKECTIGANAYLSIPGEAPIAEEEYGCIDETGLFQPLRLDKDQENSLKALAASGKSIYGLSKIDVQGATVNDDGSITMPPGKAISVEARENANSLFDRHRTRKLAHGAGAGDKYFLVVRVTGKGAKGEKQVHEDEAYDMSNNLFGTHDDLVNLKSQMSACSDGKYNVIAGGKPGYDVYGPDLQSDPAAIGVIDITLSISLDNDRTTVRNAVLTKTKQVLDAHFKIDAPSLATYADHFLFSLERCYQECGWAAYAAVGGHYPCYQGADDKYAGIQVRENGHNLYLAHSGGLDGKTYSDHTCSMGNPLYGDELGEMCFNPAKLWQLQHYPYSITETNPDPWYIMDDFVTVDTSTEAQAFQMIGIGEYSLRGNGFDSPRKPVVLRVPGRSGVDQYIGFNSAKGANKQNDEASDQVTIVEWQTGSGYANSILKGYITSQAEFKLAKGRTLVVQCINTDSVPSVACVCVKEKGQTCPNPCNCPAIDIDCAQITGKWECRNAGCSWDRKMSVCE
jgi:hypothetical protein